MFPVTRTSPPQKKAQRAAEAGSYKLCNAIVTPRSASRALLGRPPDPPVYRDCGAALRHGPAMRRRGPRLSPPTRPRDLRLPEPARAPGSKEHLPQGARSAHQFPGQHSLLSSRSDSARMGTCVKGGEFQGAGNHRRLAGDVGAHGRRGYRRPSIGSSRGPVIGWPRRRRRRLQGDPRASERRPTAATVHRGGSTKHRGREVSTFSCQNNRCRSEPVACFMKSPASMISTPSMKSCSSRSNRSALVLQARSLTPSNRAISSMSST